MKIIREPYNKQGKRALLRNQEEELFAPEVSSLAEDVDAEGEGVRQLRATYEGAGEGEGGVGDHTVDDIDPALP